MRNESISNEHYGVFTALDQKSSSFKKLDNTIEEQDKHHEVT